jgi:hypothetical protein
MFKLVTKTEMLSTSFGPVIWIVGLRYTNRLTGRSNIRFPEDRMNGQFDSNGRLFDCLQNGPKLAATSVNVDAYFGNAKKDRYMCPPLRVSQKTHGRTAFSRGAITLWPYQLQILYSTRITGDK